MKLRIPAARYGLLWCLVGLVLLGSAGCATDNAVHSDFYRDDAAATIRAQHYSFRIHADSEAQAAQIQASAVARLGDLLTLTPAAPNAPAIDITLLHAEASGSQWDTHMSGDIGVSNHGSWVGVGVGLEQHPRRYPTMVLAISGPDNQRLWLGTVWINPQEQRLTTPEAVADACLDRLVARLRRDLQAPAK